MAAGDLDGDGDLDLVVATQNENTVGLFRNNGTGGFPAGRLVIDSAATGAWGVALADLDGDGDLDVLAALYVGNMIVFYRNNGAGVFPLARQVVDSTLSGANIVLVADLNGDGARDVLAAAQSPSMIAWYANQGNGAFTLGRRVIDTTMANPRSLAVADLDGGGALDVIAATTSTYYVAWFRNNGTGGFSSRIIIAAVPVSGITGDAMTVADLNGNGSPDVLLAARAAQTLGWFRNNGTGGFSQLTVIDLGFLFGTLVAADVDRDGTVDVLASSQDSIVAMYRNDGTGAFPFGRFELSGTIAATTLLAADLNGDGVVDLAFAVEINLLVGWLPSSASVDFVQVAGSASEAIRTAFATGDLNGDGAVDVAYTGSGKVGWLRNDGSGLFPAGDLTIDSTPGFNFRRMALADLNGDGSLDVVADRGARLVLFANDGTGGFAAGLQFASPVLDFARTLTLADLNGDGAVDVIAGYATPSPQVVWLANNGTGGFPSAAAVITTAVNAPTSVTAADLNGDGALDLLVSLSGDNTVAWYRNNGTGGFSGTLVITAAATSTQAATAGDLDGDGALDVVVIASASVYTVGWFRNSGIGGFNSSGVHVIVLLATSPTYSQLAVVDLDNDGDLDVLVALGSTFHSAVWYANNGTGGFGSRTVTVMADTLVATADLSGDGFIDFITAKTTQSQLMWARASLLMGTRMPRQMPMRALPPECGGVAGSFACLAAHVTRTVSPCYASTVELPPVVRGCGLAPMTVPSGNRLSLVSAPGGSAVVCSRPGSFAFAAVQSGASLEVANVAVTVLPSALSAAPARSLFSVCTAALCDASDSASLVLRNVSVSGFRNAAPSASLSRDLDRGYGAIAVHSSSSVSLSGCAFTGGSVGSVGAALTVFGDGASVTIGNSSFVRNTASGGFGSTLGFGGGGAIAVLGAGATVALTDCALTSNAATGGAGGSGGALLVRSARSEVTLTRVRLDGNAAALAGGAIAMIGAAQTELALSDVTLSGHTAAFGGAIAAFSSELDSASALQPSAMALMPPGGAVDGGTVSLDAGCRLGASSARYGGALFACSAQIAASAAQVTGATRASGGGGLAFRCNEAVGAVTSGDSWLSLPAATGSPTAPYGPVAATPPHTAVWRAKPPLSAQSGAPWGAGSAVLTDSLGQLVVVPDLALRLTLRTQADVIGASALLLLDGVNSSYSLALVAPSARGWPSALASASDGLSLAFELSIDAGGVASSVPGSPVLAFTVGLTNCVAGWGRVSGNASTVPLVCAACSGGTFSSAARAAMSESCQSCPQHTVQSVGARGGSECVCERDFYIPDNATNVECRKCPDGASCAGGTAPPVNVDGFWQTGNATFEPCPLAGACLAGQRCARGYTAELCKDCVRGYFADARGACARCPAASSGAFAAFVLAIVGAALIALVLVLASIAKSGGEAESRVRRSRLVPPSLSMVVQALQIVTVLAVAPFSWPPAAQRALNGFAIFSLDVNLLASECTLATFGAKYAASMAAPVLFVAVLVLVALALRALSRCVSALADLPSVPLGSLLLSTLFLAGPLVYLPLARATLVLFDCRSLPGPAFAGQFWLKASLSERCFSGGWWGLFPIGVAGLALYVVGIPAVILATLVRHRAVLFTDVSVFRQYGSAYQLTRRPHYALTVALMGKKLAIAAASLFLSRVPVFLFAVLLAVILVAGLAQRSVRPYYFPLYEQLDLTLTGLLSAILVCGMMLYAEDAGSPNVRTSASAQFVVVVVIVILVALVLAAIGFVVADVREIRAERRAQASGAVANGGFEDKAAADMRAILLDVGDADGFLQGLALRVSSGRTPDNASARAHSRTHSVAMDDVALS